MATKPKRPKRPARRRTAQRPARPALPFIATFDRSGPERPRVVAECLGGGVKRRPRRPAWHGGPRLRPIRPIQSDSILL